MYRLVVLGVLVAGLIVITAITSIGDWLSVDVLRAEIEAFGTAAPLAFILLYAVITVLFLPGTPFTLLAGVLFGPWLGTVSVVVGASVGAVMAFLFARYVGGSLSHSVGGSVGQKLRVYDARLRERGFVTVLLLRLVPLFPFNGLNFGLGVTSVAFKDYALATVVGIIPGTFAYVYFGNAVGTFSAANIVIGVILILLLVLGARLLHKKFATL